jgi:hypothetical protein
MDKMFSEFYACIDYVSEPRSLAYDETIKVIQQQKAPIDLIEAVKIVCKGNEQIRYYIGNNFEQRSNKKLRELCNRIVDNGNIQRINSNPIVVRFVTKAAQPDEINTSNKNLNDLNDLNDLPCTEKQTENQKNSGEKTANETSYSENSRSYGSQGSCGSGMAVSITELSPPNETKDSSIFTDHSHNNSPSSIIVQRDTSLPHPVSQNDDSIMLTEGGSKSTKIRYTDDGRHDEVFWRKYDELEDASPNGDKTVRGEELKARLVSSNKFFVGDAVLIIERMIRTEKICNVSFDTYRRCGL